MRDRRPSEHPGFARLSRPAERAARARIRIEQTHLPEFGGEWP